MGSLRADLAALRAKVAAMTPGPWRIDDDDLRHVRDWCGLGMLVARFESAEDAAGIVALRNLAPAYLAALDRIAEIVGDTDPDHGIDDNVAIDRIRAVLAGLEKP